MAKKEEYHFKSEKGRKATPRIKENKSGFKPGENRTLENRYRRNSDENKKAMLIIGVLIIAVVLVGGGLLYIILRSGGTGHVPQTTTQIQAGTNLTNQAPVPVCGSTCLYQKAVASGNPAMCSNLSTASAQQCYEAMSNVSLAACEAVADGAEKQSCITSFAVAGDNLSLCGLAANSTACRFAVDPCAGAADPDLCGALAKSEPSLCDSDTSCILNYSIEKGSASSCNLISDTVVATACAAAAKNQDECDGLSSQAQQDYCHELYAIYTDNYSICSLISSGSSYSLGCLSSFAASMHDLSICNADSLAFNNLWACYTNYSLSTGDLSGCEQIASLATTSFYTCVSGYANTFGDPAACNIINTTRPDTTLAERDTCYQGTILTYNSNLNSSDCAGVLDPDWQNECYVEAAILQNDSSICDHAVGTDGVQNCLNAYAANQTNG
jgi:hypothetical protein